MKVLVLICFVVCANAGVIVNAPAAALVETGVSTQSRTQDSLGNYVFAYDENHSTGGTFRKEVGDAAGNKAGSYGLSGADGRVRVVNYVADANGFRVDIKSNEQGVGATAEDPANTSINKKEIVVEYAAPILAAAITPEDIPSKKEADTASSTADIPLAAAPAPQPEAPQPEAPQPESPQPEAPQPEAPQPEAPQPETPQPEAPKAPEVSVDVPLTKSSVIQLSGPIVSPYALPALSPLASQIAIANLNAAALNPYGIAALNSYGAAAWNPYGALAYSNIAAHGLPVTSVVKSW